MAHAYTPGLKVTELVVIRKERRLPLTGEVIVTAGTKVTARDVVARTFLPGNVHSINVANKLGVLPADVARLMLKKEGDSVEMDEPIAESKTFFIFKSTCTSPKKGTIEKVSEITGQVLIREPPLPVEVDAYLDGTVVEVYEKEGVLIETIGTFIQGIFGIGGEAYGEIKIVSSSPDEVLDAKDITSDLKGKVIIGGSLVTHAALEKAVSVGVAGVVVGGFDDADLREFLGYELGVAITGSEKKGITLVVTEGFGRMRMADYTYNLLKSREGKLASINGSTQIRAGVIRPEIVIPDANLTLADVPEKTDYVQQGIQPGSQVRIIRKPYFGELGIVLSLPPKLERVESETLVRILEVTLENGDKVKLPSANVEMIEN